MPANKFVEAPHLITRTMLKKAIEATNDKYERMLLYRANEPLIVRVQALARGFLGRTAYRNAVNFYRRSLPAVVKIQVRRRYLLIALFRKSVI